MQHDDLAHFSVCLLAHSVYSCVPLLWLHTTFRVHWFLTYPNRLHLSHLLALGTYRCTFYFLLFLSIIGASVVFLFIKTCYCGHTFLKFPSLYIWQAITNSLSYFIHIRLIFLKPQNYPYYKVVHILFRYQINISFIISMISLGYDIW